MNEAEFNEIINGPLWHPMPQFAMLRIILALRHVVDMTGEEGDNALREVAKWREEDEGLSHGGFDD